MKNRKINVKTIIIIVLIGIIIALVISNLNIKNTNIEKQETYAEQLTTTSNDNAYISMSDHLSEVTNASPGRFNFTLTSKIYVTAITSGDQGDCVPKDDNTYIFDVSNYNTMYLEKKVGNYPAGITDISDLDEITLKYTIQTWQNHSSSGTSTATVKGYFE